jgi:hypothetical protein
LGRGRTKGRQSSKSKNSAIRRYAIGVAQCTPGKAGGEARGWREVIDKAPRVKCLGCAQAAAGEYHGRVLITLGDTANLEDLSARIADVEKRAQFTQPERLIVSTNWNGKTLEVLTTSQKLAHRIAREVEKVFVDARIFCGPMTTAACWRK